MKTYKVHYSGYYGYTIEVNANSPEEAEAKADKAFENVSANEFAFEPEPTDIWEV